MKVFNTMTRQKETFVPMIPGQVKMYVCGPTVYNYIHIGNARSVIAFDTIRRYFEFKGNHVTYVSNFTDVDDKMIAEAAQEKTTVPKLAEKFIAAFMADTKALNVEAVTRHPRATHEIPEIIDFIQVLIEKGYAYEACGDVYYRARRFQNYGQLSGQNLEELEAGASEHLDPDEQARKEDPIDFALWKAQKTPAEIAWSSPWGKGRPGWHIECSVMSTKYLGDTFDIHGGGQDLAFPHHENEIAQSEAKTGQPFVHYWLHNGFVTVGQDNAKMSKSLHNFITVHDLLQRVDPQVLRFFMASVQYRRPINYSEQNLKQADEVLAKFKHVLTNARFRLQANAETVASTMLKTALDQTEAQFVTAMDDDFNVQNALSAIYTLLPSVNANLAAPKMDRSQVKRFCDDLSRWLNVFGVVLQPEVSTSDPQKSQIETLIAQRDQARQDHDWATSDHLREQLTAMGITIEDTPQGTRWTRGH